MNSKPKEKVKLEKTSLCVVCLYLVQMHGKATVEALHKTAQEKMGLATTLTAIRNACDALKKRGLVSADHERDEDTEQMVYAYGIKDVRFANPPEVAHIKSILPKLLESEEGKRIQQELEGIHTEGEKKGGRLPDIRDYADWELTLKNRLPILGGEPYSAPTNPDPDTKEAVRAKVRHRRSNGCVWLPLNLWLRAAIKYRLRLFNINESKALYIECDDAFIPTDKAKLQQIVVPSPPQRRGGQGTGLISHEGLPEGTEIKTRLRFPTTNGIPTDIMERVLTNGIRIGSHAKDFGLCTVEVTRKETII